MLVLFRSLTGVIPEGFSTYDGDLRREFSNSEKERILSELFSHRDRYLRALRYQASLQELIAFSLGELTDLNRSLSERLSSEF